MKRIWIGLGSALAITVIGSLIYFSLPVSAPANTSYAYEYYYTEDSSNQEDVPPNGSPAVSASSEKEEFPPVDTDPASTTVLVNHLYTLPSDYVPEDLVAPDVEFSFPYIADKRLMRSDAAAALEDLFDAASKEGIRLTAISGYRSYDRQKTIYLYNVNKSGQDYANLYSAPPGHSEHQTGLTMDVSSVSNNLDLTYSLADLPEGQWLAEHSHLFGFIIRYPEDKEEITGYAYEPWHLRYVGVEMASYLYEHNLTLDEYYGISAQDYEWSFDFDAVRRNPGNTLPDDVLSYPWQSPSDTTNSGNTNQGSSQTGGNTPVETEPDEEDPAETDSEDTDETGSGESNSEEDDSKEDASKEDASDKTDQEENETGTKPDDTTSDDTSSEGDNPDDTTSDDTSSEGDNPDSTTSDDTSSEGNNPDDTTTDNTSSGENQPDDTTSDNTSSEENKPDDTTSDGTVSEENQPDGTTSDDATSEENQPGNTVPEGATSDESTSEGAGVHSLDASGGASSTDTETDTTIDGTEDGAAVDSKTWIFC